MTMADGADPSAAAAAAAPIWERSKENAAPLPSGRNVTSLERSMVALESDEQRQLHQQQIGHYERLVAPTEQADYELRDDTDDPLIHWQSYRKFILDTFPSDQHLDFLLLERGVRALGRLKLESNSNDGRITTKKYANDARFVHWCCTYAARTDTPLEIFANLHQQRIGRKIAMFYMAWSFVAEKSQDYRFAQGILNKGLREQAEPVPKLQRRQREFEHRMMKHWLNATSNEEEQDDYDTMPPGADATTRDVLGSLSEDAFRRNDRTRGSARSFVVAAGSATTSLPSQQLRSSSSSRLTTFADRTVQQQLPQEQPRRNALASAADADGGAFPIFVEGDGRHENAASSFVPPPQHPHLMDDHQALAGTRTATASDAAFVIHTERTLERQAERRKENDRDAERWNDRGSLAPVYDRAAKRPTSGGAHFSRNACFAIHVDEECAAELRRQEAQQQREHETRRRHRDERYYLAEPQPRGVALGGREPPHLAEDQRASFRKKAAAELHNSSRDALKKKDLNLVSNEALLEDDSGREQCLEEARAASRYYRIATSASNVNCFVSQQRDEESTMSMDESTATTSMMTGELSLPRRRSFLRNHGARPPLRVRPPSMRGGGGDGAAASVIVEPTPRNNTSTCSSTIDEVAGTVLPTRRDEQTINTRFALNELSTMFTSPALHHALHTSKNNSHNRSGGLGPILNASGVSEAAGGSTVGEDDAEATLTSTISDALGDHDDPSSSFAAVLPPTADDKRDLSCDNNHTPSQLRNAKHRKMDAIEAFAVFQDNGKPAATVPVSAAVSGLLIKQRHASVASTRLSTASVPGNTASYQEAVQLLNDMMRQVDNDEAENLDTIDLANIHIGEDRLDSTDTQELEFGDISRIDPDGVTVTLELPLAEAINNAVDYTARHTKDVLLARQQMAKRVASRPSHQQSLVKLLAKKGYVANLPSLTMPLSLKGKQPTTGMGIQIGHSIAVVKQELGRGSYGIVSLLEVNDTEGSTIAIKAQSPSECLAWEYEVLKRIRDRVAIPTPRARTGSMPFPRPLAFISMADGSLMSMTSCSSSGLNLVDLANVYCVTLNERMPEELVLHYAARMLHHIELLHWRAKILHCDTKPDNWVLTASTVFDENDGEAIEAADVMLVDFGRAVDLNAVKPARVENALDTKLVGAAVVPDMMCVAMRQGLPWSFDLDSFGVCAAIHVLLFGCHLEIELNKSKRYVPKRRLKRSYDDTLWRDIFDTLLNLENKSALGSRPGSVKQLRGRIEAWLEPRRFKLKEALRRQAVHLPAARMQPRK